MRLLNTFASVTAFFGLIAALALVTPVPASANEHELGDHVCTATGGEGMYQLSVFDGSYWVQSGQPQSWSSCYQQCQIRASQQGGECIFNTED